MIPAPALGILVCAALVAGCKDDHAAQQERLTNLVEGRPIGNGRDFWLMQKSKNGLDRVALVFGFYSDMEGCTELAEALNSKFQKHLYSCQPAN